MNTSLKLNNDTIIAVHKMLSNIHDINATKPIQKVFKSIGFDLAVKFQKKYNQVTRRNDLFEQKKLTKLTFKDHELWAIYNISDVLINFTECSHERLQIQNLKDTIHQRFA